MKKGERRPGGPLAWPSPAGWLKETGWSGGCGGGVEGGARDEELSFHRSMLGWSGHRGPGGSLPGAALHAWGSGCLFLASFLLR